jgi:hypothetical protein
MICDEMKRELMGMRLSLAAKQRKCEERPKEEFPDYDPEHARKVRETGSVQGNLMGPIGGAGGF